MSMHVEKEFGMKTISRTSSAALLIAVACGLGGCAGMTTRERNTVTGAFDELLAEGYIVSRPGSGSFVAPVLPARWRPAQPGGKAPAAG